MATEAIEGAEVGEAAKSLIIQPKCSLIEAPQERVASEYTNLDLTSPSSLIISQNSTKEQNNNTK